MLALWSSVKYKNPGLSLRTGSGTDTEVGWGWGMQLEMDVINTLEVERWKIVSSGGIHPLSFSLNAPGEKVCAGSASHQRRGSGCLSSGAAAQRFLLPGEQRKVSHMALLSPSSSHAFLHGM